MRLATHILVAHAVMLVLGAIWRILPFEVIAPLPAVIYAAYLGVGTRERLLTGTATAVAIGYLADIVSGNPRGLMALVAGVVCIATRLASRRLLLRGRLFIGVFTLAASLIASVFVAALRLFHGVVVVDAWGEVIVAGGSSLLTALLAPFVFWICRLIDAAFARTARERDALREGYLS